jgi:hypothetical protein
MMLLSEDEVIALTVIERVERLERRFATFSYKASRKVVRTLDDLGLVKAGDKGAWACVRAEGRAELHRRRIIGG